jgi:hypothetical protein
LAPDFFEYGALLGSIAGKGGASMMNAKEAEWNKCPGAVRHPGMLHSSDFPTTSDTQPKGGASMVDGVEQTIIRSYIPADAARMAVDLLPRIPRIGLEEQVWKSLPARLEEKSYSDPR